MPRASEVPSSCPFASVESDIAIETSADVERVLFVLVVSPAVHIV